MSMRMMPRSMQLGSLTGIVGLLLAQGVMSAASLSSWRDTESRRAILQFVERVTREGSESFVPVAERVAVFDNDGTLWSEQPLYFQALFMFDRIRELAPEHPEWKEHEPFASVLRGDMKSALAKGEEGLIEMAMAVSAGMTTEEYERTVLDWVGQAKHPTKGRRYTELVYSPMVELLEYLRFNGFKTYIVSGGGVEFMRPWVEGVYGVSREQVIGSRLRVKYEVREGVPVLVKLPELEFIDDKAGKPVGIHTSIGRRPILAFGNSDGDFEMLEWTTAGEGERLGLLLHHTDGEREWAYDRQSHVGRLSRGFDEAGSRGWIIVDMERDWERVYAFE